MNKDRVALIRGFHSTPSNPKIDEAKAKFAALNDLATEHGDAWLISLPGAVEVTLECLSGSRLPSELRSLGYDLREIEEGERILAHRIVERFTRRADGELQPLTEGSTAPIAETRTHAGITKVKRYSFDIP
jgi:hypothetical protein